MTEQSALNAQVQAIFDAANALADEIGGVERGMNILLGPPILRPPVMIVSLQGGGADAKRQRTWPEKLVYAFPELDVNPATGRPNPFGVCLRRDFEAADLSILLKERVVASNIVFPQWPRFSEWCRRGEIASIWNSKSEQWLRELIEAISPRVILTYGKETFTVLTGQEKKKAF